MRRPPFRRRPVVRPASQRRGMTLIELVIVITLAAIIAAISSSFIVSSATGYTDLARRAQLVDAAETSLRKLARDIRRALPNSVRVDASGRVIEMLNTIDGARYREGPGVNPGSGHNHAAQQYRLAIGGTDANGFNVVGTFRNLAMPFSSTVERLAIYNQGIPGANAYDDAQLLSGSYVITNPAVTAFTVSFDDGGDEHQILPTSNFQFSLASPNQRVFVVDTPVTYLCNPGANGTITRYLNYRIEATQPTNPAVAPLVSGTSELLTFPVTACNFSYQAGSSQRYGLVTLDITVGDAESGERIRLLYQAHVDNAP